MITASAASSAPPRAYTLRVGMPSTPTLAAALAAVPALRRTLPADTPIEIALPPGRIRLAQAITITAAHGGTARAPLVIRGAADGSTMLSGGIDVPARRARAADAPGIHIPAGTLALDLAGLPNAALDERGASLPTPATSVQLFQGKTWLTPATWPARGLAEVPATGAVATGPRLTPPPAMVELLRREPALWAAGFWGAPWEYVRGPVAAVEPPAVRLAPLGARQPLTRTVRVRFENVAGRLAAGRFAFVPARRLALMLPAPGTRTFEATRAASLLVIDGAAHVAVTNIRFARAGGDAIVVRKARDIRLDDIAITQAGGNGILVDGGTDVVIRRSIVSQTGERGVVLGGGHRATLTPARHVFADGVIADFGRLLPTYRPGAWLWGVGNRITGSVIRGGDHAAVLVDGNEHRIEDNEIADVLRDTEDAGAVYGGANWTMRGNIVAGNWIHALGAPPRPTLFRIGVYLDDQFSGTTIAGNVIEGGDFGVVIGGGRDNRVTGNLILRPSRGGVYVDDRGRNRQRAREQEFVGTMEAVPRTGTRWSEAYPALAALTPTQYGTPAGNVVADNAFVGAPRTLYGTPTALALLDPRHNAALLDGAPTYRWDAVRRQRATVLLRRLHSLP